MRFPIIRVRDKEDGKVHIVGTRQHDMLYIDKRTGHIKYYNLQNGSGCGVGGSYEFVGEFDGQWNAIEYIDLDELIEQYLQQNELSAEQERRFREVVIPSIERFAKEDEAE